MLKDIDIAEAHKYANLAEYIDEEHLESLGVSLAELVDEDEASRQAWLDTNHQWIKLAAQVREDKNYPWPNAANVKYPLLTTACMQFHARALPNLIKDNTPVKGKIPGTKTDSKLQRAERVQNYMSYQILEEMEEWIDDLDRLLFVLPLTGLVFKKTYYSDICQRNKSDLCLADEVIINYHAKSFDSARITHKLYLTKNDYLENVRSDLFLDIDLSDTPEKDSSKDDTKELRDDIHKFKEPGAPLPGDPFLFYESHCWWDLDDDGYAEPYVVTFEASSRKIVRIVARWSDENIYFNDDREVRRIVPDIYFVRYIFLPDPASAIYGVGLGALLGPLNEASNTAINQMLDAGKLSTLGGGLIGRGLKVRGGTLKIRAGEYQYVNSTGDDIRKSVFPMPTPEPSPTLFNLLGLLISSAEKVGSISDMILGENPGQNQPASTSMAVLEQGLKVFSSIYRRLYRSLTKEYKMLYKLNHKFLDVEKYAKYFDLEVDAEQKEKLIADFELDSLDILPSADPSVVTEMQKVMKSNALLEKLAAGLPLNVEVVTRKVLEAEGHSDIADLMSAPEPQPNFEQQNKAKELELKERELVLTALQAKYSALKDESAAMLNLAKASSEEASVELSAYKAEMDAIAQQADRFLKASEIEQKNKGDTNAQGAKQPGPR